LQNGLTNPFCAKQVSELLKFENRLNSSLQLASAKGDLAALALLDNLATPADAAAFMLSMGG